jgi:hypothetical protein
MNSRLKPLLIGLLVGILAGLAFGWLIQPIQYIDTSLSTLREDYRIEYVLMIAETYSGDADIGAAQRRLAALGPQEPAILAAQALEIAEGLPLDAIDLDRLEGLVADLSITGPPPEIDTP